ncbi:type II toxin-antitoxin system PemK/MazF family toxin [Paractinoplanes globisporus]|jgi:mRNA interferase MazF|uniref:Type II toxin-antitoxin system PemK/MazF family toxin n=1 Tax=Paractinoplanes globisporus TaxID=113565 RepID=A0ABW6W4Q8_9ACTN|nr:type II toxin-antitoxin system PemK/MazF family toxin [Actinoplanes globisporus]
MVRRGQVWSFVQGADLHHVLVISNDEYNAIPSLAIWALAITRDQRPLGVHLCGDDPLAGGSVSIPSLVQILDRGALKENLGYVAPGTMNAVEDALREFLEL